MTSQDRGIAQLVEHRSPKPGVVSSNLTAPANKKVAFKRLFLYIDGVINFYCYIFEIKKGTALENCTN